MGTFGVSGFSRATQFKSVAIVAALFLVASLTACRTPVTMVSQVYPAANEVPKGWTIIAPAAGATNSVRVTFTEPLDHGLLLSALGVLGPDGKPMIGDVDVAPGELLWSFTPKGAWPAGDYQLIVSATLEDLAGNRIGRAFEGDQSERSARSAEPEKTLIPFSVR